MWNVSEPVLRNQLQESNKYNVPTIYIVVAALLSTPRSNLPFLLLSTPSPSVSLYPDPPGVSKDVFLALSDLMKQQCPHKNRITLTSSLVHAIHCQDLYLTELSQCTVLVLRHDL